MWSSWFEKVCGQPVYRPTRRREFSSFRRDSPLVIATHCLNSFRRSWDCTSSAEELWSDLANLPLSRDPLHQYIHINSTTSRTRRWVRRGSSINTLFTSRTHPRLHFVHLAVSTIPLLDVLAMHSPFLVSWILVTVTTYIANDFGVCLASYLNVWRSNSVIRSARRCEWWMAWMT